MTYLEEINKIAEQHLSKGLTLLGQDIRLWGGQGGVFKNLYQKYPDNVLDTPIAESATAGIATGLAMTGTPVLVEYAFLDFILHATDNIINNSTKIEFLSNGQFKVPITYYATINSGRGYGATHSQPLEYIFTNVPGLTVVYPSNATDASDLLDQSLSDNHPTLFLTHKKLLETSRSFPLIARNQARVLNQGNSATIVSYGRGIEMILNSKVDLTDKELIDLRYLNPIDFATIKKSLLITKKLLVIEDGYGTISDKIISHFAQDKELEGAIYKKLTSKLSSIGVGEVYENEVLIDEERIGTLIRFF